MTGRLPFDEEETGLKIARAVARRVDRLEISDKEAHRQIGKLGQGLAILMQAQQQREPEGQPDWLTCRDPDEARAILAETTDWLDECGQYHGVDPVACWPWHPPAVSLLLAGQKHYRAAYAGPNTVTVVDLLTRYLSAIARRVREVMGENSEQNTCTGSYHRQGLASYSYDLECLDALAIWWATDRTGLSPGLRPRIEATA